MSEGEKDKAKQESVEFNRRVIALMASGKNREALPLAQSAVALTEQLVIYDSRYMVLSLRLLGLVYSRLDMTMEALPVYRRTLDLAENTMGLTHPWRAEAMVELAGVHESLGDFDKALTMVRRALHILENNPDSENSETAGALTALADMSMRLNQYREAEPLLERALAIQGRLGTGDSLNDKEALLMLASVRQHLGKPESVKPLLQRALAIAEKRKGPDHPDTAVVLNNLALCCHARDWLVGLELLVRATTITQDALGSDHPATAISFVNLGLTYLKVPEPELARRLFHKALTASELGLDSDERKTVLAAIGRYFVVDKKPAAAILFYKMAVNTTQAMRTKIQSDQLHKALLKKNENLYKSLADLLIGEGRLAEAQRVLMMLKEDEYRDFVRRSANENQRISRIAYTGSEQPWVSKLEGVLDSIGQLARLERQRGQGPDGSAAGDAGIPAASRDAIESLKQQAASLIDEMALLLPGEHVKAAARIQATPAEGSRQTIAKMGNDVAQVSYLLLGNKLRILVARPNRQVALEVLVDESILYPKLVAFRKALENVGQDPVPLANELYRILFKPLESELAGVKTLVFSLDGALRYIPFSALHDGKRYLVQRYRIALRTAAADLEKSAEAPRNGSIAGLGVTRALGGFVALPGVRKELEGIITAVGRTGAIYLDHEFSARRLQEALKDNYSVLHIASHFQFSPGTETDSFLLLGDGTSLSLQNLRQGDYRFDKLDLLTLSACATAMEGGRDADGREVEGLAVLAQRKGARSVIATLWPIADGATAELMKLLYSARNGGGMDKAGSLQTAQLALLQGRTTKAAGVQQAVRGPDAPPTGSGGRTYAHPFYWAPFILMGNWR